MNRGPAPSNPRLLDLLLEQSQEYALVLLDAAGMIVGWLAGAQAIFGFEAHDIVGQSIEVLFLAEDRRRGVPAHELEVARSNGRAEDDRWHARKDGTWIWVSGVLVPLRDEDGELVGFGKIMRDRTDTKAQIEMLENRLQGLTRADQRKNVFLATLAHELRNPLSPLVNALQLIRLAAPIREDLIYPVKLIERQVDFIRRLVDDLTDVSRIGAGKMVLHRQRLDLNQVLSRAAEACGPACRDRGQKLDMLLLTSAIEVEGDPDRLHQVFVNLLANAGKYTPPGGNIWLKATVEGRDAVARVQDNGIGISAEMLPRIFELFTQEELPVTRGQSGLGLGLPLVRELVSLHGGSVQVRSEGRDQGSEFTVRLPLAAQE